MLNNKFAIVTGASTGIGREVAVELAKEGCDVLLVSRNSEKLKQTLKLIDEFGGKANVCVADFRIDRDLKSLEKYIKENYPHVDILCNVAGVWHSDSKPYFDVPYQVFSDEAIVDSLNVGIKATMLLTKAVLPLMSSGGRIINTSGTFGKGEKPDTFEKGCMADLVTKKAIEVFTKQLAYELEGTGITVNSICPWYVWTESVAKFYPETKDDAIPVNKVAKLYLDTIKSDKNGEIIEMRK